MNYRDIYLKTIKKDEDNSIVYACLSLANRIENLDGVDTVNVHFFNDYTPGLIGHTEFEICFNPALKKDECCEKSEKIIQAFGEHNIINVPQIHKCRKYEGKFYYITICIYCEVD